MNFAKNDTKEALGVARTMILMPKRLKNTSQCSKSDDFSRNDTKEALGVARTMILMPKRLKNPSPRVRNDDLNRLLTRELAVMWRNEPARNFCQILFSVVNIPANAL